MAHTYSGNTLSYPATFTLPDPGDLADATQADAVWEGLCDRTANLQYQQSLALLYRRPDTIDLYGDVSGTLSLQRLGPCWAQDAGGSAVVSLLPTLPLTTTLAGLSINTPYYVYLRVTSGVYSLVANTTVPDNGKVFATGTLTDKYLGSFFTDSSGHIVTFTQQGRYTRLGDDMPMLLLASSVGTSTATFSRYPSTATAFDATFTVSSSAGPFTASYGPHGSGVWTRSFLILGPGSNSGSCRVLTDTSQKIDYTTGSTAVTLSLWCAGWNE